MPTGSCGRFLFGRFATPSARTKPPGRAAQKLVRRPNKRTRQRASESTDLRTALPVTEKHSASSWTRPPRREAGPAAGRELLGATRATRARRDGRQVDITPKGLVPVPALEWRIREDVPINLRSVKVAAEKLARAQPPPRTSR